MSNAIYGETICFDTKRPRDLDMLSEVRRILAKPAESNDAAFGLLQEVYDYLWRQGFVATAERQS
jgi:hypothetical protein